MVCCENGWCSVQGTWQGQPCETRSSELETDPTALPVMRQSFLQHLQMIRSNAVWSWSVLAGMCKAVQKFKVLPLHCSTFTVYTTYTSPVPTQPLRTDRNKLKILIHLL